MTSETDIFAREVERLVGASPEALYLAWRHAQPLFDRLHCGSCLTMVKDAVQEGMASSVERKAFDALDLANEPLIPTDAHGLDGSRAQLEAFARLQRKAIALGLRDAPSEGDTP